MSDGKPATPFTIRRAALEGRLPKRIQARIAGNGVDVEVQLDGRDDLPGATAPRTQPRGFRRSGTAP